MKQGAIARLLRSATYGVSLPERFVRSLAAGLGGIVKETADVALPDVVKRTTIYSVLLDRALRFVVEDIGQVNRVYKSGDEQSSFVARKILGNFIELAGLVSLNASPLWILALVGDTAFGVRTYLDLLVEELQAKNILEASETIESVSALLSRLEHLSATGALAIDLPPTSIQQLKETASQVAQEARWAVEDVKTFTARADTLLAPMRELAQREGVSLFDVSAVMGMQAARAITGMIGKSPAVATAAVGAGAKLLSQEVWGYYADGLRQIRQRGLYSTLRETYKPYAATVAQHFRPGHRTLTDELLSGELFRRLKRSNSRNHSTPQSS